jgi:hypothetical protein
MFFGVVVAEMLHWGLGQLGIEESALAAVILYWRLGLEIE